VCLCWCVCLQDAWLRGATIEGYPHYAVQHKTPGQSVIGSQPVSLDRENLELLRRKRYVLHLAVLRRAVLLQLCVLSCLVGNQAQRSMACLSLCCRYFVTWKADGTRYVMLLLKWGTYLIDRSGEASAAAAQPAAAGGSCVIGWQREAQCCYTGTLAVFLVWLLC
jgi:hypothetical protein